MQHDHCESMAFSRPSPLWVLVSQELTIQYSWLPRSFSRGPIGKLLWVGFETGYARSYWTQSSLPQRAMMSEEGHWGNDKWSPLVMAKFFSRAGLSYGLCDRKLWPLLPKPAAISNGKRVSSHLRDRVLRLNPLSAPVQPSSHLAASHLLEITVQKHFLLHGPSCPLFHISYLLRSTGHFYPGTL